MATIPVTAWHTEMGYYTFLKEGIAQSTCALARWTAWFLANRYADFKHRGQLFVIAAVLRVMAMFEIEQDVRFFRWAQAGPRDVKGEIWWEAVARAPLFLRRSRFGYVLEFELRSFLLALEAAQDGARGAPHRQPVNDNSARGGMAGTGRP